MKFNTNFKKIDEMILKMTNDKKMDKHTLFFITLRLVSDELLKMLEQQEIKNKNEPFGINDYVNEVEHLVLSIHKQKRGFTGLQYETMLDESYLSYVKDNECRLTDGDIEETISFLGSEILTEKEIPIYAWQRRENEDYDLNKEEKEINDHFLEKDLENMLIKDMSLIEEGMVLIKNQYPVKNGRIDILARDKDNKLCIIELKITKRDTKIIEECVYYPTQFDEPVRMITIAPDYGNKIFKSLKALEYVEMKTYSFIENNLITNNYNREF